MNVGGIIGIVIGVLLLIIILISIYFSYSLLYPMNHPIKENPGDYNLKYEDISFKTEDDIILKGWYIPADSNNLVIMVHPGYFSRVGFDPKNQGLAKITNIEVKFLPTVKQLQNAGYSIIFFDLRNHGESSRSNSGMVYVGLDEYKDVNAVMKYIHSKPDLKNKKKGFFSMCTGANATIIGMHYNPELYQDIECLFALQPVAANHFIWNLVTNLYTVLSAIIVIPFVFLISRIWSGKWYSEMSPLEYCKDITCPVFYVQAKTDKWASLKDIQKFYNNSPEPKEILF
ncbi:MAG: alpha/beta hydrolase family protein, partial [Candidatus Thorarchaeota archaeon]